MDKIGVIIDIMKAGIITKSQAREAIGMLTDFKTEQIFGRTCEVIAEDEELAPEQYEAVKEGRELVTI